MTGQQVRNWGEASGGARIYQAGRDQFLVGQDLHVHFLPGAHRVRRVELGLSRGADECPYPGLVEFGPEQGRWFFGRDRLVAELVRRLDERLRQGGPLVVVAPSGAGKSSLLQAGLLPALADGKLPGSRSWPGLAFTPTSRPMAVLAEYLATVVGIKPKRVEELLAAGVEQIRATLRETMPAGGGNGQPVRLVMIVDQLEELFILCEDERERHRYLDLLAHLAAPGPDGQPPVALVVYGLRADFYGSCANYPSLRAALQDGQMFVGPMSETELREAILLPAQSVGLHVEPGLEEVLLADLGSPAPSGAAATGDSDSHAAGRLPLLAHALRATWQQRHGHILTVDGYRTTGGIHRAVATTAEAIFMRLDEGGQQAAQALFRRLVNIGGGGIGEVGDTRRRVARAHLPSADSGAGDVAAVVDAFTHGRLLTQDQGTVEITHEALLRSWPRLRNWINTDRAGNLTRQELEEAAATWDRGGHDPSRLYRGSRLETATSWADAHRGELTLTAAAFLAASVQQHRRAVRVRRATFAALTALALITSLAAVVAVRQAADARAARDTAVFNQITAEADQLRDTDASLAAQLDLTAYRMRNSPDLHTKLLASRNSPLATSFAASTGFVRSVAVSPDGRTLATGSQDRTVRLWNVADPARPTPLSPPLAGQSGVVVSVAFSPDGRTLASTGHGAVQLWSVADPARPAPLGQLAGHVSTVAAVTFSPDGRTVASAGEDGTVRLWNVTDPARPTALGAPLTGHTDAVFSVQFSPDGRTLASVDNDNQLRLWNVTDPSRPASLGTPPIGHSGPVLSVAFSPDGRTLATGSQDRTVRLWNVADPAHPTMLGQLTGHTSYVWSVAFSPDGHTLASASYDHSVQLWNVTDPAHPTSLGRPLTGHTGPVSSVAFSPDGHTLATGSHDHTVRLWNIPTTVLTGHTGPVESTAFSPDGNTLASASDDHTVRLWNVTDPAHPTSLGRPLTGHTGPVNSVTFSPDGHTLATGSHDHTVRLWNVADPARPTMLGKLTGHTGHIWSVAFSPDGHTLASASRDGTARLWNVTDPARASLVSTLTQHTGSVSSVAFSPDGRLLATGSGDTTVLLWDLTDLPPKAMGAPLDAHTGPIWSVAFSRDGRTLASASEDGTVRLWNITDPTHSSALGAPLNGHTDTVFSVAFSPDQRTLASAGRDSTVRLWNITDPARPAALGPPLNGHTDAVIPVAFSPDGRTLASGGSDHTVLVWATDASGAVQRICATARNILTPEQWQKYIPQLAFNPPCP